MKERWHLPRTRRTSYRIRRLRLSRLLLVQEARHPSPRIIRTLGKKHQMPIPPEIAIDMVGDPRRGSVDVFVAPCSVIGFTGEKIPADGRKYKVDGTVYFKCGLSLPARFSIDTTGFDFIVLSSVIVFFKGLWYHYDEDELAKVLGKSKEELLPFTWTPDRPLDFWFNPPFPMRFDPKYSEDQWKTTPKWWEQEPKGGMPNRQPDPTSPSVTPPAGAGGAPSGAADR